MNCFLFSNHNKFQNNIMKKILLPILLLQFFTQSWAQSTTTVAQEPLVNFAVPVKPNVIFTFDNSGSMDWDCIMKRHVIPGSATLSGGSVQIGGQNEPCTQYRDSDGDWRDFSPQVNLRLISPDHNSLMYDPRKRYRPDFDSSGNRRANLSAFGSNFKIAMVRIGYSGILVAPV